MFGAKLGRDVADTHKNTSQKKETLLSTQENDKNGCLGGKIVCCLCYKESLKPGEAPEQSNECSLKSKQTDTAIHLGFTPLCNAQRILSEMG